MRDAGGKPPHSYPGPTSPDLPAHCMAHFSGILIIMAWSRSRARRWEQLLSCSTLLPAAELSLPRGAGSGACPAPAESVPTSCSPRQSRACRWEQARALAAPLPTLAAASLALGAEAAHQVRLRVAPAGIVRAAGPPARRPGGTCPIRLLREGAPARRRMGWTPRRRRAPAGGTAAGGPGPRPLS